MQSLRNAKLLARLVLVWVALFLGSAVASAVIQPDSLQMVCSGTGGMKLVDTGDQDGGMQLSAGMDCPLCASVAAPPAPATLSFEPPSPLAHALRPVAAAHLASVSAPPLPSRGPPAPLL